MCKCSTKVDAEEPAMQKYRVRGSEASAPHTALIPPPHSCVEQSVGYAEVQSKGKQGGCSTHHPHPSFAFITNSEHGAMCFLRSSNLPLNLLSEPILSHLINHFIFFMILFWITPPLISQKVHYFNGYEGFLLLSCSSFNQFACLPLSC